MISYELQGHKITAANMDQLNKQIRILKAKLKEEKERDLRNNRVDKRTISG